MTYRIDITVTEYSSSPMLPDVGETTGLLDIVDSDVDIDTFRAQLHQQYSQVNNKGLVAMQVGQDIVAIPWKNISRIVIKVGKASPISSRPSIGPSGFPS